MGTLSDMPVPAFALAFRLTTAEPSTIEIGRLATGGRRCHRAYRSGLMEGRGVAGTLAGGSETLLHRPDGVTVVEANFVVQTADGTTLRLIGTGYQTDAPFAGTRMTIVIEADEDGPHAALTTRAFAAERAADNDALLLFEIE